jgi:uncharacterized protein involved in response to NO
MEGQPRADRRLDLLCREPFRLLFPLGILWSLIGATHWILVSAGVRQNSVPLYHGLMQIQGFGSCFAAGFIMTFLPRMMGAPPARRWELLLAVALVLLGIAWLEARHFVLAQSAFLAFVVLLGVFMAIRTHDPLATPPPYTFIMAGLVHAGFGAALIIHPSPLFPRLGERLVEQGMLLSFILGIGSFLGARMTGVFDPETQALRIGPDRRTVWPPVTHGILAAILFVSFWVEAGFAPMAGRILKAAVVTAQMAWFGNFRRLPPIPLLSARLLWLSAILVMAGLWAAVFAPGAWEIVALHITFIGGFGLMMLMMGLRIVTMHTGAEHLWQRGSPALVVLGAGALAALVVRVSANFILPAYVLHLAIAAAIWDVAVLAWAVAVLPLFFRGKSAPPFRPCGG